jgi:hypothetical protein
MKMEQTECSETSAYKIQTPGNCPEEIIQHLEHSESLKSRILNSIKKYQSIASAFGRFLVTSQTAKQHESPAALIS